MFDNANLPIPTVLTGFSSILGSYGMLESSVYNPGGLLNNCVSVTLAKLLGYRNCFELWQACRVSPRGDNPLRLSQIYNLLRATGKSIIYQSRPHLDQLDFFATWADKDFRAADVGVIYSRQDGSGHCVVYHKPAIALRQSVLVKARELSGKFRCYQYNTFGEDVTSDLDAATLKLVFICVQTPPGGFTSYNNRLEQLVRNMGARANAGY